MNIELISTNSKPIVGLYNGAIKALFLPHKEGHEKPAYILNSFGIRSLDETFQELLDQDHPYRCILYEGDVISITL